MTKILAVPYSHKASIGAILGIGTGVIMSSWMWLSPSDAAKVTAGIGIAALAGLTTLFASKQKEPRGIVAIRQQPEPQPVIVERVHHLPPPVQHKPVFIPFSVQHSTWVSRSSTSLSPGARVPVGKGHSPTPVQQTTPAPQSANRVPVGRRG